MGQANKEQKNEDKGGHLVLLLPLLLHHEVVPAKKSENKDKQTKTTKKQRQRWLPSAPPPPRGGSRPVPRGRPPRISKAWEYHSRFREILLCRSYFLTEKKLILLKLRVSSLKFLNFGPRNSSTMPFNYSCSFTS